MDKKWMKFRPYFSLANSRWFSLLHLWVYQIGFCGGLCNPSYWDGWILGLLVDREPPKGLKWLAEDPHYTWRIKPGAVCTPRFLQGQTEFQSALVCVVTWCQAMHQVWFPAAAVLGLTWPRQVGTFFCSRSEAKSLMGCQLPFLWEGVQANKKK